MFKKNNVGDNVEAGSHHIKLSELKMYRILNVNNPIENDEEKEVKVLYENAKAKIIQLTLRKNNIFESHKVNVPIVIQCVAGIGKLVIENVIEMNKLSLLQRTIIALEANVLHSIVSKPPGSLLLLKLSNTRQNMFFNQTTELNQQKFS